MKKWLLLSLAFSLAMALLAGVLAVTPAAHRLDNRYGLGLLFWLRGPIGAPEHAIVAAIDRRTINWLREVGNSPANEAKICWRACRPAPLNP